MVLKPKPYLHRVQPCPHGSFSHKEAVERGVARERVLDFSASCNPLGPAPRVLAALSNLDVSRYPDSEATELRVALARPLGLDAAWIAVGNGSAELMWLLATAFLRPGDRVLVVGPTFGEYARACQVAGASVETVAAGEQDGFRPDPDAIERRIAGFRPRLVFLCNPNNPTGQILQAESILRLLEGCEETLLVVDEAYLPFCRPAPDLVPFLPDGKLLLLRSMTKDHALAGLRLGYAVAHPDLIQWLDRVRPPWNVNAAAQAAGLAALVEGGHVEEARRVVEEARRFLSEELSGLGLEVIPSAANFLLVRVGRGNEFRAALLDRGICVRDCASFGLPAYVRIGVRTLPECRMLVDAVREVVDRG
ncbi:MAG: pyridoxal phosphate-dependent aminotransferase [Sphingomonadaceae bacterium]